MTLRLDRSNTGPVRSGAGRSRVRTLAAVSVVAVALAGCQVSEFAYDDVHLKPVPAKLERKMDRLGVTKRSPMLIRIFKEESELEVWKADRVGRYKLLETYEICAWSGELGPKFKEGDRQAPEGFYHVTPGLMNPNSSFHLAFNIGFPNQFDRSHNRTGTHLMVHGECSSAGCYAMENDQIEEIYALAREAFRGGQKAFQVQAFPFRMTPANMAKHADHKHLPFWEMLKEGSDHFEVTKQAPQVNVCGQKYVFNAADTEGFSPRAACPAYEVRDDIEQLVAAKRSKDLEERKVLIARAAASEDRKERWAERERAIAEFFDRGRRDADAITDDATPAGEQNVVAAVAAPGTPFPRRSPRGPQPAAQAAQQTAERSGGFRIPNPFRRNDPPVQSTSGVVPAAPEPVAPARQPVAEQPAAVARVPGQDPVEPLAYAPQNDQKEGFFSGIAKGTTGLWKRAGSIFN
ncbi:MAG: murein L,D-transpeptidase family protein [Pseudomonadota bacterium]